MVILYFRSTETKDLFLFHFKVDHPYRYLIEYAKCLKGTGVKLRDDVVQMAWNFVNDSLGTTLCLQWEPEIIAVAMIYLACKISNFNVVDWKGRTSEHQKWWDMFVKDMSKQILDDICHQVSTFHHLTISHILNVLFFRSRY